MVGRSLDGWRSGSTVMVTPLVTVPGTWSRAGDWWSVDSIWWSFMRAHGFTMARAYPFEWEAELGSSWMFWRRMGLGERSIDAWVYSGKAFQYFCEGLDGLTIVAHSHGGQPVFYAAAAGVQIDRLLTIGTPYRADMEPVIEQARPNIRSWWHVSDLVRDWTALWGRLGDGVFGGGRKMAAADQNLRLHDIGHSRLLSDPKCFPRWTQKGVHLVNFLHGRPDAEMAA